MRLRFALFRAVVSSAVAYSLPFSPFTVSVALAQSSPGDGAPTTSADKAIAEALFNDARKLSSEGKHAEACPKLVESQRRDPGIGTLLYLGACYEKTGKLASAWATFREAAEAARAKKEADRTKIAEDRAAAIEEKVPKLTLLVPEQARGEGLVVMLDGADFARVLWGSALPVDGGKHVIEARAPRKKSWSVEVVVGNVGDRQTIAVPALVAADETPAPPPAASSAPPAPAPVPSGSAPAVETKGAGAKHEGEGLSLLGALRLGYALPVGQTGATDRGSSQRVSSLVAPGPALELHAGLAVGRHLSFTLFYGRSFLGASTDLPGADHTASGQAVGLTGRVATAQSPRGPVGFYGELGVVPLRQVEVSARTEAGGASCRSTSTLTAAALRVGAGANLSVLDKLVVSPLVSADIGRFHSASLSTAGACARASGDYAIGEKAVHALLFAGLSIGFPVSLEGSK